MIARASWSAHLFKVSQGRLRVASLQGQSTLSPVEMGSIKPLSLGFNQMLHLLDLVIEQQQL